VRHQPVPCTNAISLPTLEIIYKRQLCLLARVAFQPAGHRDHTGHALGKRVPTSGVPWRVADARTPPPPLCPSLPALDMRPENRASPASSRITCRWGKMNAPRLKSPSSRLVDLSEITEQTTCRTSAPPRARVERRLWPCELGQPGTDRARRVPSRRQRRSCGGSACDEFTEFVSRWVYTSSARARAETRSTSCAARIDPAWLTHAVLRGEGGAAPCSASRPIV